MLLSKRVTAVLSASLLTLACQAALAADSLNFVSWGGTTQDAQKEAWAVPFTKATNIKVVQDGPTDYGKLKAMVESGNVQWDVVDVEADFALRAASEGLLEPLDFNQIKRDKIDPRFVSDHGVGSFFFSFVLGYNEGKLGANKPVDWTALFDTKAYPGKRALYKWPSPGVLELALLADGVAPTSCTRWTWTAPSRSSTPSSKTSSGGAVAPSHSSCWHQVKPRSASSGMAVSTPCSKTVHRWV